MRVDPARALFAITAAIVLVAIVIQVPVAAGNQAGFFDSPLERGLNVFAFFTIQSNLLVGVTCLLLALDPERSGTGFAVLRLTSIVAITITAIVFHTALRDLQELDDWAWFADALLHTLVPLVALGGWLLFGPRGLAGPRVAALTLAFPLAWLAFTLLRGEATGFYPYPFLDVAEIGIGSALRNCALVALLFCAVALAFAWLDARLRRRAAQS